MAKKDVNIYDALLAGFTLLSNADGELHASEKSSFIKFVSSLGIEKDLKKIEKDISTSTDKLLKNYTKAKKESFKKLEALRGNKPELNTLTRMLQVTIIADQKVRDAEDGMMAEILNFLDISET